jgi:hypothetical protein
MKEHLVNIVAIGVIIVGVFLIIQGLAIPNISLDILAYPRNVMAILQDIARNLIITGALLIIAGTLLLLYNLGINKSRRSTLKCILQLLTSR